MDEKEVNTMSLSLSEKDNIIAFLGSAYARSKIEVSEYERRLDLVNSAKTREDLEGLIKDLVIAREEITDLESITLKMENRIFPRSTLVTKKLVIAVKYVTIVLDYSDIDFPDGTYEIQMDGEIANITIKAPIQYSIDNQISANMVTVNEDNNDSQRRLKSNVTIKLTGNLKKSEVNIIRL